MMDFLQSPFSEWNPFLFILLAGALPTQIWRWLGAVFAKSLDEESEFLKWVKAVATALVAGLIAKLVVFPSGSLADIPLWLRLFALLTGYGVFFLTRPNIVYGIVVGEIILISAAFYYF